MHVRGHGLDVDLPAGWEAAVRADAPPEPGPGIDRREVRAPAVLHAGTFALPPERGDYGSRAVDAMRPDDSFVALLEFGPEEVGTELFAAQGLPRRLDPRRFSGRQLQRSLPGQVGWQHFFTAEGRPFCLYVVLGDGEQLLLQCRKVEQLLAGLRIEPDRQRAEVTP